MPLASHVRGWYNRHERRISSLFLVGGFIFDTLTLRRVDLLFENLWIILYLALTAGSIILLHVWERNGWHARTPRMHFWFLNIMQFSFGGLLSAFLVLYFRSSSIVAAWPFLLLLAIAFILNERLKQHYARLTFQISFFFLCIFSFAIFAVPVLAREIGPDIFFVSGFASILTLGLFLWLFKHFVKETLEKHKIPITVSVVSIFLTINAFYFFNLIPPIPLALKDGGIYHSVKKNTAGDYVVQKEHRRWFTFLLPFEIFHAIPADSAYAYSAIFSPARFNTDIVHEWQKYDTVRNAWITQSRVPLSAVGGRIRGYRTYSVKTNITPGKWRVNILTNKGQIIGRLRFNAIPTDTEPILITEVKL